MVLLDKIMDASRRNNIRGAIAWECCITIGICLIIFKDIPKLISSLPSLWVFRICVICTNFMFADKFSGTKPTKLELEMFESEHSVYVRTVRP